MKQSKTTLKELTAAYRAVLCCNAVALGLISAPAVGIEAGTFTDLTTAVNSGGDITLSDNMLFDDKVNINSDTVIDGGNNKIYGGVLEAVQQGSTDNYIWTYTKADGTNGSIYQTKSTISVGNILYSDAERTQEFGTVTFKIGDNYSIDNVGTVKNLTRDADNDNGRYLAFKDENNNTIYAYVKTNGTIDDITSTTKFYSTTSTATANQLFLTDFVNDGEGHYTIKQLEAFGVQQTEKPHTMYIVDGHEYYVSPSSTVAIKNMYDTPLLTGTTYGYVNGDKAVFATSQFAIADNANFTLKNVSSVEDLFSKASEGGALISTKTTSSSEKLGNVTIDNVNVDSVLTKNRYGGIANLYNRNVDISNSSFKNVTMDLVSGGGASAGGALYLVNSDVNVGKGVDFTNNVSGVAGAIYMDHSTLKLSDDTVFDGNKAAHSSGGNGGAIIVKDNTSSFDLGGATFKNNSATGKGGAIHIDNYDAEKIINIGNAKFIENSAQQGGAISLPSVNHDVYIGNAIFKNNKANDSTSALGGAVAVNGQYSIKNARGTGANDNPFTPELIAENLKTIKIDGATFEGNEAYYLDGEGMYWGAGGAIGQSMVSKYQYFSNGPLWSVGETIDIKNSTFDSNIAGAEGGALNSDSELNIANSSFSGNKTLGTTVGTSYSDSNEGGGAIFMYDDSVATISGTTFDSNESGTWGGAIATRGVSNGASGADSSLTITDSSFTNNIAGYKGGAIASAVNTSINAVNKDVVLSGNKANGISNDIYMSNTATTNHLLTLNAATGRTISLEGGIDGNRAYNVALTGNGLVNVAGDLNKANVALNSGELWLSNGAADGSNLTDSTIAVASGATLNTMDKKINEYSGITLASGANLKTDIDLSDGSGVKHDSFAADGAFNLTGLGITQDSAAETVTEFALSDKAVNVAEGLKAYTTALRYDISDSETTGNIKVTSLAAGSGGLRGAVNDTTSGVRDVVAYTLTDNDATVATDSEIKNADLLVRGEGTEESHKEITLSADLTVGDTSTLSIENAKFAGTNSLVNTENATLNIKDSLMRIAIINHGTLISDPTTYTGTVTNTGTASFVDDTFASTAILSNSGNVSLSGDVTFESGAEIQGTGTTNLASGTTHFNNTESTNVMKLASGADFDGTLLSGTLNTQNNNIDSVSGNVSSGDLYVDANLSDTGAIDSFASSAGATIKNINLLSSEYGDSGSYTLNVGGASLANDLTFSGGTNYYTKFVQDGNNIIFGDKLLNTSGMHNQLGSWTAGNYIAASNAYDTATDSYTSTSSSGTVGAALTALDTQVKTNADNIALKANTADLSAVATSGNFADLTVADGAIDQSKVNGLTDALAGKQSVITTTNKLSADLIETTDDAQFVSAADKANWNAKQDALTEAQLAVVNSGLTADKVNQIESNNIAIANNSKAILTLNGDVTEEGSVANMINKSAENSEYNSSVSKLSATTIKGAIDENAAAIATLNGDVNTNGSVAFMLNQEITKNNALTLEQANAYTDERVDKLDKELSDGVASAVALSSVSVSNVRRGEVSVGGGYGYYNGQSAMAFGAAMGLSNRWSVNAGTGVSGSNVSFRAGTNYKFKLF